MEVAKLILDIDGFSIIYLPEKVKGTRWYLFAGYYLRNNVFGRWYVGFYDGSIQRVRYNSKKLDGILEELRKG